MSFLPTVARQTEGGLTTRPVQLRGAFDGVFAEGQACSDRGGQLGHRCRPGHRSPCARVRGSPSRAGTSRRPLSRRRPSGNAVRPVALDLSDEGSIQAAADQVRAVGALDHLISVATERANGPVVSLERRALLAAFDAKVLGPILLAKHFAPMIAEEGSLLFLLLRPGRVAAVTGRRRDGSHQRQRQRARVPPSRLNWRPSASTPSRPE